jgi:hypothetical protein
MFTHEYELNAKEHSTYPAPAVVRLLFFGKNDI